MNLLDFVKRYPIAVLFLVGWVTIDVLYLRESYAYCQNTYSGTVSYKSESAGRSSTYYLQVVFDNIPTQSLIVHPITYSRYSVGDRFSTKSSFSILFGRDGIAYVPDDPKFKILNCMLFAVMHMLLTAVIVLLSIICLGYGLCDLNKRISNYLNGIVTI